MKVLVTGATGVIGRSLVAGLIARGFQVKALCRTKPSDHLPAPPVEVVLGDITDRSSLKEAVQEVSCIFHLAAKLHINDPGEALHEEYWRINVEGTRRLTQAAVAAGVSRIVYFSTIAVYGANQINTCFNETSELHPQSLYAKTKHEAEKIVLSATSLKSSRPIGVVLRPAAVYGPYMKGNYRSLVKGLRAGYFIPIGKGVNRRTLIHVDDLVEAAITVSQKDAACGRIYNVTDGHTYPLNDIIRAMCKALGRRPPRFYISEKLARRIAGILALFFRWAGRKPLISSYLIDRLTEDVAADGAKLQHELHFVPQVGLNDGWRRVIQSWERG